MPSDWGVNIASQLSWVNLLYEVIEGFFILLLFFLLGKFLDSKEKLENKTRFKIIISGSSYAILSILIITLVRPHCKLIATNPAAIDATLSSRIYFTVASIPAWKSFIKYVLNSNEYNKIFNLLVI
ncbi:hypothetical protein [Metamycoplasma equirhinis]|uniref:hypothetical protein n=1 Tax=Metamycoplasma equirhinis TaxID=92402 RepID=UPI003594351C